jgi:hypothetical protein
MVKVSTLSRGSSSGRCAYNQRGSLVCFGWPDRRRVSVQLGKSQHQYLMVDARLAAVSAQRNALKRLLGPRTIIQRGPLVKWDWPGRRGISRCHMRIAGSGLHGEYKNLTGSPRYHLCVEDFRSPRDYSQRGMNRTARYGLLRGPSFNPSFLNKNAQRGLVEDWAADRIYLVSRVPSLLWLPGYRSSSTISYAEETLADGCRGTIWS